jgi:hypothetical protein
MRRATPARDTTESSAQHSYPVTPHDSNEIGDIIPRAIRVDVGGTVVFQLLGDTADRTITTQNGDWLPISPRIIKATGTTASGIMAFF